MEEITSHISPLVSLLSGLAALVIGFIWYHEKALGSIWMTSLGKSQKELSSGNMILILGLALFMSFVLSFFLQALIEFSHWHPEHGGGPGTTHSLHTFKHGAYHGMFFGLFIAAPIIVIKALFERFDWKYMLVHIGYWVLTMAVMGGIVDTW